MDFKFPDLPWPKGTKWAKLPSGRLVAEVLVSPELAEKMLALNADNQRRKKLPTIARYAQDMRQGVWRLTHQGIAFNRRGFLHDGQNRLSGVIESGRAVLLTVWVNAGDDKEMAVTDVNAPRTVLDAANVVRMDFDSSAPATLWAAVRYGIVNGGNLLHGLSHTQKLELLEEYNDKLQLVCSWFGSSKIARKIGSATVRAAVFCAQFYVSHKTIERFVRVLTEQLDPLPGERVCQSFRQYVLTETVNSALVRDLFLKTCRAIESFANKAEPSKIYAAPDNPFPFRPSSVQLQDV